jgi:hypothetical protein
MPRVFITKGSMAKASLWTAKQSAVTIDTNEMRHYLNIKNDRLILSIRDTIMIKSLRSGRNVILFGDHSSIESLERVDEVLQAQSQIDNKTYTWKLKEF